MKLLFVSNLYPPHGWGGYEEWCQEVARWLGARGHQVVVLTSRNGTSAAAEEGNPPVYRQLYLEMELSPRRNAVLFFTERKQREVANLLCLQQHMAGLQPDAIMIWGMWNVPRSLPALCEKLLPKRTVYYFGDYWPTLPSQWWNYWEAPPRHGLTSAPKHLLAAHARRRLAGESMPALRFDHALFPSQFMRHAYHEAGVTVGCAETVLGGVDTAPYLKVARRQPSRPGIAGSALRLLVTGRLVPDKGIHTAIEALAVLRDRYGLPDIRLTVAGGGEPDYTARLEQLIATLELGARVRLLGPVPKMQMPDLYGNHDVLVFPSVWPEPFGRVLVEAMVSGLAVVGTTAGGAGEILRDGETGLVFQLGDADGLAAQVARLANDASLRSQLAWQGQSFALANFDISSMAQAIERYLQKVIDPT